MDNDADWPAVILRGKQDASTTRGTSGGKQGMKPGAFQHLEHDPYYFHTNPVFEQFYDWERLEQMRAIQQQQGAGTTSTGVTTSAGQYPGSSAAAGGNFENHVAHHAPLPPVPPPAIVPSYHGGAPGVDHLPYAFAPGTRTTSGGRGYGKSGPDPLMDRKGGTSKQGAADGGKNNSRGGSKGGGGGPPNPNRNRKGSGGGKQGGSSFGANQDGVGGGTRSSSSSSSARNSTGPPPKLGNNELLHQRSSGSYESAQLTQLPLPLICNAKYDKMDSFFVSTASKTNFGTSNSSDYNSHPGLSCEESPLSAVACVAVHAMQMRGTGSCALS